MHIGAHVSSSISIDRVFDRACAIEAEALQTFASAPRSWRPPNHNEAAVQNFRRRAAECGIDQVFFHAIYLVNLASEQPALLHRSIGSLKLTLRAASELGARGVIFHVGSHKGAGFAAVLPQIIGAIADVLAETPEDSLLIVENSAGMGGSIGSSFAEVGAIVRGSGSDRVRVCLDTCHTLAAGYELRTPAGLEQTLAEFDREVGLDRLAVIHANDSKVDLGGGRDRHENVGEGFIGLDGFATLIGHSSLADVPLILEVPGFEGNGPDRRNIDLLRDIRTRLGVARPDGVPIL